MNRKLRLLLGIGSFCLCLPVFAQLPYQNPDLSPEKRANDLLSRLTLDEKVLLMQNTSPAIPRLGIKAYDWWNEALHGVGRAGLATVFPQSIGMGASFNNELLLQVFTAVSDEARAKSTQFSKNGELQRYQGLTMWTPNINIFRDPRWGRGQETYGEDPYLTAQMGMAVVRGLQGPEDQKYDKLHACAKHFAVHSGPEWNRHSFNAEDINPRDLWETYLPAFKDLVQKANVKEVMCAYNRLEGDPCCGSNRLLMQILRNEWGYQGLVVSDCGAVSDFYMDNAHKTHPDKEHASAGAVLNGTDVECGTNYASLPQAVRDGLISEESIDTSVRRLLKARFALGEMDTDVSWNSIPYSVVDSKEHRELALRMAHESIVLLQNKKNILPLTKKMKIAVVGPNANDSVMQWGNYNGFPSHTVTLLEGIKQYIPEAKIIFEPGCDHTSADIDLAKSIQRIKGADVVIFAGGISPSLEGEEMSVSIPGFKGGDRETIELPAIQSRMIAELKKAGKKVVFVNFSGSAIAMPAEKESCDAILQVWYPGQAGGTAIADVLFGTYNPAGRLPVTFYKSTSQLPDFEDYTMKGRTYRYMTEAPLFPFGYGLSYTTFQYGNAALSAPTIGYGEKVTLTIPVSNIGKKDGEEVVQVYVRRPGDTEGPSHALRAFKRVAIAKGQASQVEIPLLKEDFEWFDTNTNTMRPIEGEYELLYGGSSDMNHLKSVSITVK
ncbi:glycoside hydrolase family 3 C-terminal domain-containing protein [uncultured Bacteroides sp.]|uniref:glycoside hydrolase family 3 C-terminal domain-containing protein n=1 Tax=uncultured Bacteroides sp. TaxID=162156 RepID=UPI0025CF9BA3|nr:glycoside hydrolase family 3 C-terminal domain-containing protein [uncultured Bacteroides sp.]